MNKTTFSLALDSDLFIKIVRLAKEKGLTKSGLVRMIIMDYFKNTESK